MDERIKKLAKILVHHSCRVQKGEKVYLNYVGQDTKPLARQLMKEIYEAGGNSISTFHRPADGQRNAAGLYKGTVTAYGRN